jgi:hypothetical protein
MKKITLLLLIIAASLTASSQQKFGWAPFLQQTGMYYSSGRVSADGYGLGIGSCFKYGDHLLGQVDINLLWGIGNTATTRIAAGYQRKGAWTPALLGTVNLVWTQKVEFLSENGERPPSPVCIIGLRVLPLRFETKAGFISALEFGYGFGPDKGQSIEVSFLSLGFNL